MYLMKYKMLVLRLKKLAISLLLLHLHELWSTNKKV